LIGTVVLIKGIDTFNPERGTRLAIHAARCIENEILMHLLVTKRRRSEVSIYNPIGHDREGNEITPPECPPSGVHPGARHCTCDWRRTWSPPVSQLRVKGGASEAPPRQEARDDVLWRVANACYIILSVHHRAHAAWENTVGHVTLIGFE